jgi:putative ABC transport system ATP-binding protein
MKITADNLLPLPIKELEHSRSEVWERSGLIFESGSNYLVQAPSGMGKTTLLSIFFGLRRDYTGRARIDDDDVSKIGLGGWTKIRRNRLSFVFQGLRLFPQLTAMENIQVKNRLTNFKTTDEIVRMAKAMNIESLLEREAQFLSFGQQQRVAIVRALCQPFGMLLLDEPFSHLDKANVACGLQLIADECKSQNAGFVLTSLGNDYDFGFDNVLNL